MKSVGAGLPTINDNAAIKKNRGVLIASKPAPTVRVSERLNSAADGLAVPSGECAGSDRR
ncbi:hypothetical protein EI969_08930 [Pseudomonas sp. PB101]|nr:hypothetical protein [Pseudomonas sp. PB101]